MTPLEEMEVSQTNSSDERPPKLAVVILLICMALEALSTTFHIISPDLLANLFTFVQVIFCIIGAGAIAYLLKAVRLWIRSVLRKLWRGFKTDILLNYAESDFLWKAWIQEELEQKGFDVKPLMWGRENNFPKKSRKAECRVKRVLSIMSPEMLELAQPYPNWFHEWKKRNSTNGLNELFCTRKETYRQLTQIDPNLALTNLAEKNTVEHAREKLDIWLLHGPQKQKLTSSGANRKAQEIRYPGELPSSWNLPERNQRFIGREKELQILQNELLSEETRIILYGLRGIGKTEIVKEYAYSNQDKYTHVFWLSMESQSQHDKNLRDIAEKLSLGGTSTEALEKDFDEWLLKNDKWLLILHECQEFKKVEKWLNPAVKGKLLVTASAKFRDSIKHFKQIEIKEIEQKEAEDLILRYSEITQDNKGSAHNTKSDILNIITKLGRMPEALEAASLYIKNNECSPGQYLKDYQQYREKLQKAGQNGSGNSDAVEIKVVYSWWLYFDRIQNEAPKAAEVLKYCVLLDPVAIPVEIIENISALGLSGAELTQAITRLGQFFLVKRNRDDVLSIDLHIQNYFQDWLDGSTKKRLSLDIVQALSKTLQTPSIAHLHRSRDYDYTIQVKACEELIRKYLVDSLDVADLYNFYGYYLLQHVKYKEAQKYLQEGSQIQERLYKAAQSNGISALEEQEYQIKIATNKSYQAELFTAQGENYQRAEELWNEVLLVRENILGKHHVDVATTRYYLARMAYISSRSAEFEQQCRDLLDNILPNILKSGSCPQALSPYAMINLLKEQGALYYMRKDYTESAKKYQDAIVQATSAKKNAVPGIEQDIFSIEIVLCEARRIRSRFALRQENMYEEIKKQYLHTLKTLREQFGEFHPEIAQMHLNLGDLHRAMTDEDAARASYKQAEKIYKEIAPGHDLIIYIQRQVRDLDRSI